MELDDDAEDEEAKLQQREVKLEIDEVIIHPLVLLSAADHYHRVARGTRKRVVGVLLGQVYKGKVDATNSFAVPFEEDSRNPVGKIFRSFIWCCLFDRRWRTTVVEMSIFSSIVL